MQRPKKKILYVLGTRPEAIKLAPLIKRTQQQPEQFRSVVCVSAQHREMMDAVLDFFSIVPEYDLNIMRPEQTLFNITSRLLNGLASVLTREKPDLVLVQGDTTTAFTGALAAFYAQTPIGHIEAGLRTHDRYSPFPEEMNRQLIGGMADFHFAPTSMARHNLLRENIPDSRIWVTGNTGVDALMLALKIQAKGEQDDQWSDYFRGRWRLDVDDPGRKIILVTGHRRENFGEGLNSICLAIKAVARTHPEVTFIYPVHLNPNVKRPVESILGSMVADPDADRVDGSTKNVFLIDPLEYAPFVYLMKKAYLILTDSGGIQEEAPSLGKPVLVMRRETERTEGVDAGTSKLVGTDRRKIVSEIERLLTDTYAYGRMTKRINPYGDGEACRRITEVILDA